SNETVKPAFTRRMKLPANTKKYTVFYKPMLATLVDAPFDDKDWVFELKWDGYRAIAEWQNKQLKLYSRNGISFSEKFPAIAEAVKKIKHDVILDGEIVLINEDGSADFQKLQHYEENNHLPLEYYVFDLLSVKGKDIRDMPLIQRKELLKTLLEEDPVIKY